MLKVFDIERLPTLKKPLNIFSYIKTRPRDLKSAPLDRKFLAPVMPKRLSNETLIDCKKKKPPLIKEKAKLVRNKSLSSPNVFKLCRLTESKPTEKQPIQIKRVNSAK